MNLLWFLAVWTPPDHKEFYFFLIKNTNSADFACIYKKKTCSQIPFLTWCCFESMRCNMCCVWKGKLVLLMLLYLVMWVFCKKRVWEWTKWNLIGTLLKAGLWRCEAAGLWRREAAGLWWKLKEQQLVKVQVFWLRHIRAVKENLLFILFLDSPSFHWLNTTSQVATMKSWSVWPGQHHTTT